LRPFALLLTEKAAICFCALANKEKKILEYVCIASLGQEIERIILRRVREEL
jgi:hypothetical protein